MGQKLRVGIIGTGNIADAAHGPAVAESDAVDLVAVLSRSVDGGKEFLSRHQSPTGSVHGDIESFVADSSIDLVIVASPDRLHFKHAAACLEAGKHVLLEKPLAISTDEAVQIVKIAKEENRVLATGFHLRSHAGHQELRRRLTSERVLGQLRHVRVIWGWPNPSDDVWRASPELGKWWSLAAVGTHCIDLARWFTDDMDDWKQFSATVATNMWGGPHDETAVIGGQLRCGATVELVSSIQFGPYMQAEVFGSEGMALCDGTLGRAGAGSISINGVPMEFDPVNPFKTQVENIAAAILSGKELNASGDAGLRSVRDLLLALDV